MEQGQSTHNFTVCSSQGVEELDAVLHLLNHKKSGARLVWLERKDENKTFCIAFQTQPWDDTGVFHILEHSVLCGSAHYPVKEPFVELMKSSLQTFLNAMTFPDKTVYPVSSRNEQDFVNLLRVYMDAVLHPLIYQKPEIFCQEGWHYELAEDGTPSYKGVVFNEMKGSFASPDSLLEREISRRLFPDTCYRYVFGGDPEHIPDLNYEQFIAAHSRLYHPSNAYIFLDGSVDIEKTLGILDEEYLSAYDRIPAPEAIPIQKAVDAGTSEIVYELSSKEELQGRARLVDGFVACNFQEREELTALQVLADVLCGDNQAPLKRRLLESELARDVRLNIHDGIQQPWITLEIRDIREDQAASVSAALREELERLAREGLNHGRILATLDNLEFQARQRDYGNTPQGLVLGMQVLESWLYGGDPTANLSVGTLYDGLRKKCGEGYFEFLLERMLLRNPHKCRVLMRPSHTVGQERRTRELQRLQAAQSGWSRSTAAEIQRQQANIEMWQTTPDTSEQLASIPLLRLEQIPVEPEKLLLAEESVDGVPVLCHEPPAGGITYLNLYFAIDDFSPEHMTETAFLAQLFGSLDTENFELEELQQELRSLFGQIQFTVEAYGRKNNPDQCRTFLCVSCSILDGKLEKAASLLAELVSKSRLSDAKRVFAFLCQRRAMMAQQMIMSGHMIAIGRTLACSAAEGVVQEQTGGVSFYWWLTDLERNFQERFPALTEDMTNLAGRIFSRSRLTISVTSAKADAVQIVSNKLSAQLPERDFTLPAASAAHPWGQRREGIVIPADISFAAISGIFPAAGRGAAKVMSRAVSLAYLWNAVRVQGGAYGTGMLLRDTGLAAFYSFRDPSAARTLDCYRGSADFLHSMGNMDLTGFIIGAVAESDPLLTPRMRSKIADVRYWRRISHEDLCRVRHELLSATPEDLAALADAVEQMTTEGSVCVLGAQKQIDACAGQLDSVIAL